MQTRPCPSVCYLHVLSKAQGKETWALPEILPRLWTTIWQRKAIWKTYFQTNAQELSTLCIYPKQLLNNTKNVSIKKTLSVYLNSCPILYPAASEEHPMNSNDPDRVLFWKSCNGKKCINSYTGLEEGRYLRASS